MRPLIVTEFISIDGVMEAPGGGEYEHAGWTFRDIDFVPEAYEIKGAEQEEAGALLLGRQTFTEFAPVWPTMPEFATYNALPKYVVSSSLTQQAVDEYGWGECHLLTSLDDVAQLREQDGGPILVHGSATLVQSLMTAGLVDQLTLLQFPVTLGRGKRLFAEQGPKTHWELSDSKSFSNGIQQLIYRRKAS